MKALIFAAGLGTRLRPITDNMPKALVPVGGVPMLERVLLKIKDSGISEFVVNVHHFSGQIRSDHAVNLNPFFSLSLRFRLGFRLSLSLTLDDYRFRLFRFCFGLSNVNLRFDLFGTGSHHHN